MRKCCYDSNNKKSELSRRQSHLWLLIFLSFGCCISGLLLLWWFGSLLHFVLNVFGCFELLQLSHLSKAVVTSLQLHSASDRGRCSTARWEIRSWCICTKMKEDFIRIRWNLIGFPIWQKFLLRQFSNLNIIRSSLTTFTTQFEYITRWQRKPTTTPKSSTSSDCRRAINQNISSRPATQRSCNRGLIQSTSFVPHSQRSRSKVNWVELCWVLNLKFYSLFRWCWKSETVSTAAVALFAY